MACVDARSSHITILSGRGQPSPAPQLLWRGTLHEASPLACCRWCGPDQSGTAEEAGRVSYPTVSCWDGPECVKDPTGFLQRRKNKEKKREKGERTKWEGLRARVVCVKSILDDPEKKVPESIAGQSTPNRGVK